MSGRMAIVMQHLHQCNNSGFGEYQDCGVIVFSLTGCGLNVVADHT